jgi:hypothetical protein
MDKTSKTILNILNEGVGGAGCLMVNFPLTDSVEILKWVQENVPQECIITPEREIHVTVLYGIKPTVPVSEIQAFVESLPMVVAKLGPISFFNQPDQDVLKVTVDSPQLQEINQKLKEYLGEHNIEPSKYPYNPHLTLAYVKPGSVEQLNGHDRFNGYVYLLKDMTYSEPGSIKKHQFQLSN